VTTLFSTYRAAIISASEAEIRADVTLANKLLIAGEGRLTVSYAPFDHVVPSARVVLVGITPGAQQAANALIAARSAVNAGLSDAEALKAAKVFASFSGPMRNNLVLMLDHVGLADWLGVRSCSSLWSEDSRLVHFTSALRYPVFVDGANYSGQPSMVTTPILQAMLKGYLGAEADALRQAVWVPLGPKAAEGVGQLVKIGRLDAARVLAGLPHPSGANAERIAYFLGRKDRPNLSIKTDPDSLDRARNTLLAQLRGLSRADA
jgi:hypothetical protein